MSIDGYFIFGTNTENWE